MPKAARFGDSAAGHGCMPATPILAGSGDVSINGMPAARKGDMVLLHMCPCPNMPHGIHMRSVNAGSSNVSINGKPAARVDDAINCGGKVAAGSPDVLIGDTPYQSPAHKCAEGAVASHAPMLNFEPMLTPLLTQWSESATEVVAPKKVVSAVELRKARYESRKTLVSSASDSQDPDVQAASERLAMNNDSILRAEAAQYVYRVDENRRDPDKYPLPEPPVGLELLDKKDIPGLEDAVFMDEETGFGAALFQSDINDETMLTFRGTNNGVTGKQDWMTNGTQGIGKESTQYNQAMDLAELVSDAMDDNVIVGHSLGGGLAASGVGVTGNQGHTFNAAGLHPKTVARNGGLKMNNIEQLMQTQAVNGEVLTLLQSNRKLAVAGLVGGTSSLFGNVGMAVGGVLSAAVLASGALPEAPGTMSPLESIDGGSPVTRHGMDQVIAGIEAQKEADIATLSA
ncbi:PAAR domain-containing protein [uncultured Shewanella sp.]|uniref:PAAR domain-containing protein n=1 Tax=uncultured Shewanella sp. TaxID=173975 RepID=UPI00261A33D2|nr:PAAR domain-containing protein [uncultured Shewanella sp.]